MPSSSSEHVGAGLYFFSFSLEFFVIFIPSYSDFCHCTLHMGSAIFLCGNFQGLLLEEGCDYFWALNSCNADKKTQIRFFFLWLSYWVFAGSLITATSKFTCFLLTFGFLVLSALMTCRNFHMAYNFVNYQSLCFQ
jgi:hypothetical protein